MLPTPPLFQGESFDVMDWKLKHEVQKRHDIQNLCYRRSGSYTTSALLKAVNLHFL